MEAERQRRARVAHPRAARRDDRPALLSAVDHRPARAGVVRAHLPGRHRLPALRAVELRVAARAGLVSVRPRAVGQHGEAISRLEPRLRPVRAALYRLRALQRAPAAFERSRGGDDRSDERRPQAGVRRLRDVALLLRDGLVHAARGDEPHHARRRVGAFPVDPAAHALSPHVHPVLRRPRLVPALYFPGSAARRGGRDGVGAARRSQPPRHQGSGGALLGRAFRVLHVLSRRAREHEARAALSHELLSDGLARRRAGRLFRGLRRAAHFPDLLRVRDRPRGHAPPRGLSRAAHAAFRAAARRRLHGLHRLPRLPLHRVALAQRARDDAQFLRHAARARRRLRRRRGATPHARRDHARRAVSRPSGASNRRRTMDRARVSGSRSRVSARSRCASR